MSQYIKTIYWVYFGQMYITSSRIVILQIEDVTNIYGIKKNFSSNFMGRQCNNNSMWKSVIFSLYRQQWHLRYKRGVMFMCTSEPHTHPRKAPRLSLGPGHLRPPYTGQTTTCAISLSQLTVRRRGTVKRSLWCHSGWATSHWVT